MLQSEIRMCAGIGKSQNEDIVLNFIDKHPVILDVAITKTDKVSNESMVAKLRTTADIFLMSFPRLSIFLRLFL